MTSDIKDMQILAYEDAYKKQIEELKVENETLKSLLKIDEFEITKEQIICETQLSILKDKAVKQELNADETRRFATFVEVLEKIKKTSKDANAVRVEKIPTEDLLRFVSNDSN